MGYDFDFRFIKDEQVDADKVFIQNVDNFLFQIHFGYLERYKSDIKLKRNILVSNLLRDMKSSIMGGGMQLGKTKKYFEGKIKHIEEEKDPERKKIIEDRVLFEMSNNLWNPHSVEHLMWLNLKFPRDTFAETEVNLMLYCLFVNSLSKTKPDSFSEIKELVQPLVDFLRKNFREFDKNEIHKERTFIYHLRSPTGLHDDFYVLEGKDYLKDKDIRSMSLTIEHEDEDYDKVRHLVKNVVRRDEDLEIDCLNEVFNALSKYGTFKLVEYTGLGKPNNYFSI